MKIVFMGTPQPAAVALNALIDAGHDVVAVYTQPDRPSGRGSKIKFSPVKQIAIERDIVLYQPDKLRGQDEIERFRAIDADVAAVVAYGRILPVEYLNVFPKGAVNLHFSLLPKYRGAAPVNWAIVNGESTSGVTTMLMDEGLDTGPILLRSAIDIAGMNSIELMERSAVIGAELLVQTFSQMDELSPIPQDDTQASYAPIMKRSDGEIDWQMTAYDIGNRIRGFQPFPGSFSFRNGAKVSFWKASPIDTEPHSASVGTIVSIDRENVIIACGSGTLLAVSELQLEGKRRMTAAEVANGKLLSKGDKFGSPATASGAEESL